MPRVSVLVQAEPREYSLSDLSEPNRQCGDSESDRLPQHKGGIPVFLPDLLRRSLRRLPVQRLHPRQPRQASFTARRSCPRASRSSFQSPASCADRWRAGRRVACIAREGKNFSLAARRFCQRADSRKARGVLRFEEDSEFLIIEDRERASQARHVSRLLSLRIPRRVPPRIPSRGRLLRESADAQGAVCPKLPADFQAAARSRGELLHL